MEKKGRDPNQLDSKYADIDNTLKDIDRKIKEGNVLGHNKVSAMAEQFANKSQDTKSKVQRSVNILQSDGSLSRSGAKKSARAVDHDYLFCAMTA